MKEEFDLKDSSRLAIFLFTFISMGFAGFLLPRTIKGNAAVKSYLDSCNAFIQRRRDVASDFFNVTIEHCKRLSAGTDVVLSSAIRGQPRWMDVVDFTFNHLALHFFLVSLVSEPNIFRNLQTQTWLSFPFFSYGGMVYMNYYSRISELGERRHGTWYSEMVKKLRVSTHHFTDSKLFKHKFILIWFLGSYCTRNSSHDTGGVLGVSSWVVNLGIHLLPLLSVTSEAIDNIAICFENSLDDDLLLSPTRMSAVLFISFNRFCVNPQQHRGQIDNTQPLISFNRFCVNPQQHRGQIDNTQPQGLMGQNIIDVLIFFPWGQFFLCVIPNVLSIVGGKHLGERNTKSGMRRFFRLASDKQAVFSENLNKVFGDQYRKISTFFAEFLSRLSNRVCEDDRLLSSLYQIVRVVKIAYACQLQNDNGPWQERYAILRRSLAEVDALSPELREGILDMFEILNQQQPQQLNSVYIRFVRDCAKISYEGAQSFTGGFYAVGAICRELSETAKLINASAVHDSSLSRPRKEALVRIFDGVSAYCFACSDHDLTQNKFRGLCRGLAELPDEQCCVESTLFWIELGVFVNQVMIQAGVQNLFQYDFVDWVVNCVKNHYGNTSEVQGNLQFSPDVQKSSVIAAGLNWLGGLVRQDFLGLFFQELKKSAVAQACLDEVLKKVCAGNHHLIFPERVTSSFLASVLTFAQACLDEVLKKVCAWNHHLIFPERVTSGFLASVLTLFSVLLGSVNKLLDRFVSEQQKTSSNPFQAKRKRVVNKILSDYITQYTQGFVGLPMVVGIVYDNTIDNPRLIRCVLTWLRLLVLFGALTLGFFDFSGRRGWYQNLRNFTGDVFYLVTRVPLLMPQLLWAASKMSFLIARNIRHLLWAASKMSFLIARNIRHHFGWKRIILAIISRILVLSYLYLMSLPLLWFPVLSIGVYVFYRNWPRKPALFLSLVCAPLAVYSSFKFMPLSLPWYGFSLAAVTVLSCILIKKIFFSAFGFSGREKPVRADQMPVPADGGQRVPSNGPDAHYFASPTP